MRRIVPLLFVGWSASVALAQGAPNARDPRIGYVYPAGGQQGTTFYIVAGGQRLRNTTGVYVSGEGVRGTVVHPVPRLRTLDREQIQDIRRRIEELRRTAPVATRPSARAGAAAGRKPLKEPEAPKAKVPGKPAASRPGDAERIDVTGLTLRELESYVAEIRSRAKRQLNAQIADVVLIEITIDPKAAQGDRELRLLSPAGLSNPIRFQVGTVPEVCEQESIGPDASEPPVFEPPFMINGQVMPGDVDRFRFHARSKQRLVIAVQARQLIPYLADAVPGWFQAALALYDAAGHEVAFVENYRFSPDPVLLFQVPQDGEYQLEIRDALYRGREDFVYRISVGESLFVTQAFPLGGQAATARVATVAGWNLPGDRLRLELKPGPETIRQATAHRGERRSNEVLYQVDALPDRAETEPNDDVEHAQAVPLQRIINGRIDKPGDVDAFRFSGRKGEEIVAEVYARRLNSPLDARLDLMDTSGTTLASNDDSEMTATGLLTHHADSCLRFKLPLTGDYSVQLTDVQRNGGPEYGYRLRLGHPQPDFELCLTPSSINVPAGRAVPVRVHVLRKDGFDGAIDLLLRDAPRGFSLAGARIPPGRDSIRLTITAPRERPREPLNLEFEGRAVVGGKTIRRPVIPAEEMMQAFIYRHWVPSQEFLVAVTNAAPPARGLGLVNGLTVHLRAGGTAEVRVVLPPRAPLVDLQAELCEPPEGVTLQSVTRTSGGLTLVLKADADAAKPGFADNLIVQLFIKDSRPPQGKQAARQGQLVSLGYLPAIPLEIIRSEPLAERRRDSATSAR